MLDIKTSGFDKVINQIELYYNKVVEVTEEAAEESRKIIIARIESGKNSSNKTVVTRSAKKHESGYYSKSWGDERAGEGLSTAPMNFRVTGGLFDAFTYRKKYKLAKGSSFTLQLYVKNNKVKGKKITYAVLAAYHEEEFGVLFRPTKGELDKISKLWKRRLSR